MPQELQFSRRKALAALGTVGVASAGAGLGTSAYFSDQETFENNQLTAGELDVKVGWSEHYSDWSDDEDGSTTASTDDDVSVRMYDGTDTGIAVDLGQGETGLPANDDWLIAVDDPGQFLANTQQEGQDLPSDPCTGLDVPDDLSQPVIELSDVKPGDFGEVTIDFALCDNPGYVWLFGDLVDVSENRKVEPEADDPDENTSPDPSGLNDDYVELLDAAQAAIWVDDGDNYQDGAESYSLSGSLRDVLNELDSGNGLPLVGDTDASQAGGTGRDCFSAATATQFNDRTHSVVFAWWLPVDHANEIQTDSVTFDLGLYTEQCRHNDGSGLQEPPTRPTVFEVTEGFGATGGQTFDLETEIGFAEPMVTSVDTSSDPIVFTLDVPEDLDRSAGDQWELVLDANNDPTVDFRIVFDEFFYQEWDKAVDDWGPQQSVPADIETGVVDGIYVVRIPRDRLSDPFSFGGRVCYVGRAPGGTENLCINFVQGLGQEDIAGNPGRLQEVDFPPENGEDGDTWPPTGVEETFYTLKSKKLRDLCTELKKKGPKGGKRDAETKRKFSTNWSFNTNVKVKKGNGDAKIKECTVTVRIDKVSVDLEQIVEMPKWENYDDAPDDVQQKWDSFIKALRKHEKGHMKINRDGQQSLIDTLSGIDPVKTTADSCERSDINKAIKQARNQLEHEINQKRKDIIEKVEKKQKKYDENTKFGREQGATLKCE